MEQVILGGNRFLMDDTLTQYNMIQSGASWNATEAINLCPVSADGVFKGLRVKLSGAPGAGNKYTFTFMLNGAPTALTFDIADADTIGSNMVNEITVAPGNTISLRQAPDSTPTEVYATWTIIFEGDVSNESLIMGRGHRDRTGANWFPLMCGAPEISGSEANTRQVIPTGGSITDFYLLFLLDPGDPGDGYTFTVHLNGAAVAQSPTITIMDPNTTGNDLAHSMAVVADDIVQLNQVIIATPAFVSSNVSWCVTFVATIDYESIVMGGSDNALDNSVTEYLEPACTTQAQSWTATENQRLQLGQRCTIKKLHMFLTAAPGAGNTYTFTIRVAGANSNVVVTFNGVEITRNSFALEDTVADDDYMGIQVVPDDTPNAADAYWGFVIYREPVVGGGGAGAVVMGTDSLIDALLLLDVI